MILTLNEGTRDQAEIKFVDEIYSQFIFAMSLCAMSPEAWQLELGTSNMIPGTCFSNLPLIHL